jgi:uncharacterized protein (DUF58 family)
MTKSAQLVPSSIAAQARSCVRFPVAFGRRFFLVVFVGLAWLGPAWWDLRYVYGMALWDLLAVALWAWDLSRLPDAQEIEVLRTWSAPVGLATPARVEITVRNHGRLAISASIVDDAPAQFRRELPALEIAAPAGGEGHASYMIDPRERGDTRLGGVSLRYRSPLLLAERWAVAELAQTVRVYPNLEESKRNTIYLIRSRQIEVERRLKRQRGYGREFQSLREYHEGDEWRDICWTATARRGKLTSKVFQVERSQTVWLVLDAGRLLRARVLGLSKLDFAVNAALSLAQVAFYSGDRVALLAYGRRPQQRLAPGRGPAHLRALAESLAQVRSEAQEADHYRAAEALLAQQKRRSLVVWLTDLTETATTPEVIECASRMSRRHLVLFVVIGQRELGELVRQKPGSFSAMYRYAAAQEIIQQRDLLLRRLRQQGALTVEIDPARLSATLVNQYLDVKDRGML